MADKKVKDPNLPVRAFPGAPKYSYRHKMKSVSVCFFGLRGDGFHRVPDLTRTTGSEKFVKE